MTTKKAAEKATGDLLCCREFDPAPWDEKEITWKDKPFLKESTWCFLHVPLNFGGATNRFNAKVEAAPDIKVPDDEFVMLSDMRSPWSTRIYFSVAKDSIPSGEIVKFTGTFLTKVFEGPYKNFNSWIAEMKTYVKKEKGQEDVKSCDLYAYYATCPKCAKKYGKNYVVLFAKVA